MVKSLVLALAPAFLLGAYAWFPSLAFLAYLAPVPWIVLYTDPRRPKVPVGWFLLGIWATWMVVYRYGWTYGWFVPPFASWLFILPWTPWAPALRCIHASTRWPRTLTVAVVTVAIEWLRVRFAMSHFDIYLLGYSQARFPVLIQVADLTGVYGVSFLVAAVNGLIADAWFAFRGATDAAKPRRMLAYSASAVAGLFLVALGYGMWRLTSTPMEEGPRLAVVQPNVRHTIRNVVGVHVAQMLLTDEDVPDGAADLIVWPENAVYADVIRESAFREDLAWLASKKDAAVLVGAQQFSDLHAGRTMNSAVLIGRDGNVEGVYAKRVLYPYSEYVPFDDFLGRFAYPLQRAHRKLARMGWGFLAIGLPGKDASLLRLRWNGGEVPFGAQICVENTYPPVPAEAVRAGARFLVNITSEGEVTGPVQEQLLRVCILRAVENRVGYVRCGNTGISAFIDPTGRIRSVLRGVKGRTTSDAGVLLDRVMMSSSGATLYARTSDAFALACLAATGLLVGFSCVKRRRVAASAAVLGVLLGAGCGPSHEPGTDAAGAPAALGRAKEMAARGQIKQALPDLAAACADERVCREAIPMLVATFASLRADEAAADFFEVLVERWPGLAAESQLQRGHFLEASGDLEGALRAYDASLAERPSTAGFVKRGKLLLRLGRSSQALAALREAAALAPRDPRIVFPLAQALAARGDRAAAIQYLEISVGADPSHASSWALLGRVRIAEGDREAGEAALRKAIEANPENITARYELARMALREGRRRDAERYWEEISRIEASLGRGPSAE